MDLRETGQEAAFRREVRDFVQTNLPGDIRYRVENFLRVEREDYVRWQKILYHRGWGAPGWPVDFGGTGWNAVQRHIFEEECFSGGAPRQMPFGLSMVAPVLQVYGTEQQQARYLPGIISGEELWCQGYSEPGAGSDLAALKTQAERVGGKYIINGQKVWTSFAHWAQWMFCLVRTSSKGKPQQGISFVLIDMKTPGLEVRPIVTLDQGSDVNEVFLNDVEIPLENRVGEENNGWTIAKYLLGHERANIAGVGMCKRLLTRLREYAGAEQEGARPLIEDPRFRDRIAKVEIDLLAHEWSLMRLISMEQSRQSIGVEASILKIRGSEIQLELAQLLMECAGPYALPYTPAALEQGYAGETAAARHLNPLAGLYFDMHKVGIYGGTNEVQKNIISKSVLGR